VALRIAFRSLPWSAERRAEIFWLTVSRTLPGTLSPASRSAFSVV